MQTRTNGYAYNISIPSEAFGFVTKYGINKFRLLIDIIDVDKTGEKENILSTSRNRIWGNPATFNTVTLNNKIKVNVIKNIPTPIDEEIKESPYSTIFSKLPDYYIYTTIGWIPISVNRGNFMTFDEENTDLYYGYGTEYYLNNISDLTIEKSEINYHLVTKYKNTLEYFDFNYPFGRNQLLVLNRSLLLNPEQIIKSFILPNGNIAFIYTEYESFGRHGDKVHSILYLFTDHSKEILAEFNNHVGTTFIIPFSNINVMKKLGNGINKIDFVFRGVNVGWHNIVRQTDNNAYLYLDLGSGLKYKIEWDEQGKIIKAVEE